MPHLNNHYIKRSVLTLRLIESIPYDLLQKHFFVVELGCVGVCVCVCVFSFKEDRN